MLMETEQVREPVSTLERERTMRSLVDMQKKVEQRQQRDRERQLLRVRQRGRFFCNDPNIQITVRKRQEVRFDRICLPGSGALVNHPEQKSRGRSARPEAHRQAEAPHPRSTTGNDFRKSRWHNSI